MNLEVGQVLWLRVRYKTDVVANCAHPMLVAVINIDEDKIEVIAIDKARNKIVQLYNEANRFLDSENPKDLISDYKMYHKNNFIPDERKVHMTKEEIIQLNDKK